ncbi:MAG: MBL fold metallo-hydrolase [Chloroflexi bacterium]|nr:MBL fold metallo-hydrolase [Chloroflexota bacterium]
MDPVQRIELAYNNVYLAENSAGRVLVDAGPDYLGARAALADAVGDRALGLVVATHGHVDHAGLGRWWQERGVPVALAAADAPLARSPHFIDIRQLEVMRAFMEGCGAPPDVRAEALAALERRRAWALRMAAEPDYPPPGSQPRWPSGLRYEAFEPDVIANDGDLLGGLRVRACPGHTPGNLVLVDEREGWLFSGDQLLPDITPTPAVQPDTAPGGGRFRSLPAFVDSLRRLQEMQFTRCFPGHGEPFDGVAGTIAANLAAVEERSARVYGELRSAGPDCAYALSRRLYPRALRRRFWQIISTVQGHLDLLEAEGRVVNRGGSYEAR